MDNTDVAANKKQVKNEKNISKRLNQNDDSMQRLRSLYLKTEEMKLESEMKNQEMENQFKELHQRLKNSSGFLNQIKKSIENIKFSYQRDILDLDMFTEQSREDMDQQIEEIRMNIGRLQSRAREDQPKPQTYQDAITGVLNSFQSIAQGQTE